MQLQSISFGFHDVVTGPTLSGKHLRTSPELYALSRSSFHQHLQCLKASTSNSVQTISRVRTWEGSIPIFLTFDDGAVSAYECIADVLEEFGWRGHFLVTSDWIDRAGFMNKDQIRDLHSRGHIIGSHSRSHPERMSSLSWNELMAEWSISRAVLEDIIGARVAVASVANGYHSTRVGRSAACAGIEVLFTSEPRARIQFIDSCLVIGRYSVKAATRPALTGRIGAGRRWPRGKQVVLWQSTKLAKVVAGEFYLKIRKYFLSRSNAMREVSETVGNNPS